MGRQIPDPPRIGVISPCGGGNLGDAAIVAATIEGIRARVAAAAMFAMTLNPNDTERRHRIPAYRLSAERYVFTDSGFAAWGTQRSGGDWQPLASLKKHLYNVKWLRPLLRLLFRVRLVAASVRNEFRHVTAGLALARDADLFIVAGGGQLDDYWGGAWAHPYNLLKWGCIARATRTPIVILSVGYGTQPSRLSRLFLRATLKMSAYSSFRDQRSASIARDRLGQREPVVVPDLAFGLPVDSSPLLEDRRRMVVAISPIAFGDPRSWPKRDAALYDSYLGHLAEFVAWLSKQGHELIFFCTDNMDVHCLRDLHARCSVPLTWLMSDAERPDPYYKEVDDLVAQLAQADLVVASRLHGVILAHRLAKPVLAVSYDWKVDIHMEHVGEGHSRVHIRELTTRALIDAFRRLAERRTGAEQGLRRVAADYAGQVGAQFDLVVRRFLADSARQASD